MSNQALLSLTTPIFGYHTPLAIAGALLLRKPDSREVGKRLRDEEE
jgi:hypothetical protein